MNLTTERLRLRPLSLGDLKSVYAYAGNRENTKYMLFFPHDTEEETAAFLRGVEAEWQKQRPSFYEFAVELNGSLIGAVFLYPDTNCENCEIGWILHRDYWNRGYGSEAVQALIAFARDALRVHTLIAHCDARNTASAKMMEKLGMTLFSSGGTRTYKKRPETAKELAFHLQLR